MADQSGLTLADDDQIVTRVTQHLLTPPDQLVKASGDHSNSLHESNKDGVKAYAKISAQDWTYYVTTLKVNIGRSSDPPRADQDQEDGEETVQIDLGPSKLISRQHALIYFHNKEEKWYLLVNGRNALKVDGISWRQGQSGPLSSGEVIEVGGIEMMFVLPIELSPLNVHEQYLQRAGITKPEASSSARPVRHPLPSGDSPTLQSSPQGKPARGQAFQKPLAPAPPHYKRPGTPPSASSRTVVEQAKSPHLDRTGPMLMNPNDVDLSLDSNKHIKPQYSYAQMITQAILNTDEEKLNLNGIYNFIMNNYSYYKHQPASGWQVCSPLTHVCLPCSPTRLTWVAELDPPQSLSQQGL